MRSRSISMSRPSDGRRASSRTCRTRSPRRSSSASSATRAGRRSWLCWCRRRSRGASQRPRSCRARAAGDRHRPSPPSGGALRRAVGRAGDRARRAARIVGRSVRVAAKAKLNLALAVVGKRDDGYHELRSVFVTLDLADDVRVAPHKRLEVRNTLPLDGEDLAARAVTALARATGREPFAFVSIRKRIPLAAGMGGGSSDAAATLHGLAQLWGVDADLMRIGAELGSDVPFLASGARAAFVSGRGELVRALAPPRDPIDVVVLRPPLRLPTAEVFGSFTMSDRVAASRVEQLVSAFEQGRVTPDVIRT